MRPARTLTSWRTRPPWAQADWCFFLDLDGTLVEFADSPGAVTFDLELQQLIGAVRDAAGGAVAMISGRALSDLEMHFGALRLPMAGQHGLERRDAQGRLWIHPLDPCIKLPLRRQLEATAARFPALLLEDKGLTLALHYRRRPQMAGQVHRLMAGLAAASNGMLQVQRGKYVAELKPAGFDKGSAIEEYLAESPFHGRRPVFLGDDLTDEQGFAAINRRDGISVKVGKGPSIAHYRLPNVAAVRDWLGTLLDRHPSAP